MPNLKLDEDITLNGQKLNWKLEVSDRINSDNTSEKLVHLKVDSYLDKAALMLLSEMLHNVAFKL